MKKDLVWNNPKAKLSTGIEKPVKTLMTKPVML